MKKPVKLLVIAAGIAWFAKEVALPAGVAALYSFDFMAQSVACDSAMEADWYERRTGLITQQSADVDLLACHEYDKTRKVLLWSGLPETYLSWLGLHALELYQRSPEEFVAQHRFMER